MRAREATDGRLDLRKRGVRTCGPLAFSSSSFLPLCLLAEAGRLSVDAAKSSSVRRSLPQPLRLLVPIDTNWPSPRGSAAPTASERAVDGSAEQLQRALERVLAAVPLPTPLPTPPPPYSPHLLFLLPHRSSLCDWQRCFNPLSSPQRPSHSPTSFQPTLPPPPSPVSQDCSTPPKRRLTSSSASTLVHHLLSHLLVARMGNLRRFRVLMCVRFASSCVTFGR